ncbi:SusC/RagA family TonB-linked outer membrane protein [Pontibacter arcticus]|uniref:SusC/RagA family TonB-linked outer membrane protein n=1 Tax=Pontibacter arcticus TaxID=2080288 RepID=A0A364RHW0_9BACT|nr:SusC/RagA family TonB-linked outer membrane protein [Pontibacter arcticus]RAU83930.1 SusC/RagA family TonB-linked outer membrane protein [Pontibacter arcticus]
MRKILLLNLALLLCLINQAWAQSHTVSGTVTDATTGQGLPGVGVTVNGSSVGTYTSANGAYTINAPSGDVTMLFKFLGYQTQEIALDGRNTLNVQLAEDTRALNEVVVVGYSTSTQESFTGTAKVISAAKLESKSVSNVSQALAGEVAGVRVVNTSGQPGTVATIRIRGLGSVNGNRDPLYVVDGIPFSGSLNSINPADIASTTVLKDAAATAIYGARGANGVVLITTKTGKGQKSYIEADVNVGTNMNLLPRYSTIKSPEQYIGLAWESLYNQGAAYNLANPTNYANSVLFSANGISPGYNMWNAANGAQLIDPVTRNVREGITRKYTPENWEDYGFQNSARQEVNVKFGGSSNKTCYFSSFGYLKDKGYLLKSDFERTSARLNVNQEINKWLNGSVNIGYARTETNNGGQTADAGSIFWFVDNIPSIYPLFMRDAAGQFVTDPIFGGNQFDYGTVTPRGFGGFTNAIADATYNTNRNNRNELNGSASLNVTILDGLTLENRIGVQYYHNKFINRGNKYYGNSASQNGSLTHQRRELFTYNLLNLLRYNKTFGQHNLEVLGAHEATDWNLNTLTASGFNLVDPNIEELNNAVVSQPSKSFTQEYALESYFGQINYSFDQKYFVSATLRRDGSSKFRNDKWGNFGSVGAAWLLSNEGFMANQNIFNSLKLKASYGLIGDQAGVGYYPGYDLLKVGNLNDEPALSNGTKGNPDLTWETSKMFQTGIEFGLGNYLSGSVDYYIKNTEDLIFDRGVGPSLGYATIKVNDGKLRNRGVEFDLTGHLIKKKDLFIDLGVNGEMFDNEITSMPIDPTKGQQEFLDVQGTVAWAKGHSVYDYYLREWAGVDPIEGVGTWNRYYADANSNDILDEGEGIQSLADYLANNPDVKEGSLKSTTTKIYSLATTRFVGKSSIPKIRGAFNLVAGYKGFEFSAQMLYSVGGYAYDGAYALLMDNGIVGRNNWHTDILGRWQSEENPGNGVPRLSNNYDPNASSASTRFLTKANYLILNNIRLGYALPASYTNKFGIGGLSVWVSGDNLWINSARKGFNPTTSEAGGSSSYRYSPLSTVTAGLKIKI